MFLNCRFTSCEWCGSNDEIFEHFETKHKKFLREPKGNLFFDLSFDDLQHEVLVLCSPNGLYWLRQNLQQPRNDGIDFGVFHIGESEQVQYKLKLGLKRDGHCEYLGTYTSKQDGKQHPSKADFDLSFNFVYLELLNETMPSRRMRLYFGEFDDSDDKISTIAQNVEWTEEDERLNHLCIERFTCAVCFEFIRRDARFCENKHFICLNCFDQMLERKKLKCPTCRGHYLYDCIDHDVERLLRMVKWPDLQDAKVDREIEQYL